MLIRYVFSACWTFVLLVDVAGCVPSEQRPSYQEVSVPKAISNNAPDVRNEDGNIPMAPAPVLAFRARDADDLTNKEGAILTVTSTITLPPTATSCQTFGQCFAHASSVSIYYWASEAPDTSCLATLPDLPENNLPSGLTPISPSIYAVIVSLTRSDGCEQIGSTFNTFIASFAPDEVSTITDSSGEVAANDFGNAPCGPPGWVLNGQPYQPWFKAPQALFEQMGDLGYSYCAFPELRDPSYTLIQLSGPINGPVLPPKAKRRRYRRVGTEEETSIAMDLQSVYHVPISQRHLPMYRTAATTAHGVPQPPIKTPNP